MQLYDTTPTKMEQFLRALVVRTSDRSWHRPSPNARYATADKGFELSFPRHDVRVYAAGESYRVVVADHERDVTCPIDITSEDQPFYPLAANLYALAEQSIEGQLEEVIRHLLALGDPSPAHELGAQKDEHEQQPLSRLTRIADRCAQAVGLRRRK